MIIKKMLILFISILIFFIILEILLRLFSFFYFFEIEQVNKNKLKDKNEIRILCLGESTTAGTFSNAYPRMLEEILISKGKRVKVINKGIHKTNSTFILEKVPEYIKEYNPQIVVAMMGINDDSKYYEGVKEKESFIFKNIKSYQYLRSLVNIILNYCDSRKKRNEKSEQIFNRACLEAQKGNYKIAEAYYKESIALNKKNMLAYLNLFQMYFDLGEIKKLQEFIKKIELLFKDDALLYVFLGSQSLNDGDLQKANNYFEKAVSINPNYFFLLGDIYYNKGDLVKAESVYTKAVVFEKNTSMGYMNKAYVRLGEIYKEKKDLQKAMYFYKKALISSKGEEKRGISNILFKMREVYYNNNEIELSPLTYKNYIKLNSLIKNNIKSLVCVQYPRRSIAKLKKMFGSESNILFVDNEQIFDNAVETEGYAKLFIDVFAGDFGHCTIRGNTILAENIANVLIESGSLNEKRK